MESLNFSLQIREFMFFLIKKNLLWWKRNSLKRENLLSWNFRPDKNQAKIKFRHFFRFLDHSALAFAFLLHSKVIARSVFNCNVQFFIFLHTYLAFCSSRKKLHLNEFRASKFSRVNCGGGNFFSPYFSVLPESKKNDFILWTSERKKHPT